MTIHERPERGRTRSPRTSPRSTGRTRTSCSPSSSRTCASTGRSCGRTGPAASRTRGLLHAMTPQEMAAETTSVYDNYVEVLETGSVEALQRYARDLSERIIPRGVETHEVVGIVLLLRDVLARSLFEKYQRDFGLLNRVLDAYEPAANRIANTVAVSFVDERERVIRQQQDSIRELSTPVLPGPRATADPADHRRARQRARPAADRAAADRHPHPPRQGRRHRHHRRPGRGRDRGEPPGPDGGRLPPHGRQRHHHRAVAADRPDTGHDRGGPQQDGHHRRPAGRAGGGRAAAGLQRSGREHGAAGRDAGSETRLHPATGPLPDRVDPHRARRHPDGPVPRGPDRADRAAPVPRRDHRRRRARRPGLLRRPDAAHHRARWRGCAARSP